MVLLDQPPNPLVEKFLQSLTNNPIQFTDHPTTSRQESRVIILFPSLFGYKVHSKKTQSEESQSNPSSPRRHPSNSTALGTSTQEARASLSRPNRFQRNQQISKQERKESYYQHHKSVRSPRYKPYLHYQLTNAFFSWEVVFWDHRRQEYTIQKTALTSQRLVVPLATFEVQPVGWHWIHMHPCLSRKTAHNYSQNIALSCWSKWMHPLLKMKLILLFQPSALNFLQIPITPQFQLHLLTTRVDQLRIISEQALEQTKPLIQTFHLANMKQSQYLHAVQHQVAQFFVDLNVEESERLKLCTTIRQLEDELVQLRREVNDPSRSSLPVPFTVDPPSAAFQILES